MSQDVLLTVMNSMSLIDESVNVERKRNESCDKCFNLEAELLKSQNAHNNLLKRYSQLEKHCISLEASIQLNQEIFQKHESFDNQNALEIPEFLKNNDLKAQLQDKDTTICKLKDIIKSMREKSKEDNVNYDYCEIETKNIELENNVAKLLSKNERLCKEINHVKQELLVYVRDTFPNAIKLNEKKVAVKPKNKVKKVRFAEPLTSSSNIKQCGSKPTGNKRNDRISQTRSRNIKNKVEAQPRKVNKKNRVVEPIRECSSKKAKIVESKNANHSEPNHTWGSNAIDISSSSFLVMTVRFENDNIARIMGYGDYQLGNVTISMDRLFQPMFNEYFTPPSIAVSPVQEAAALRAMVLAESPVSTSIDPDALSSNTPSTQEQ
ncbi:hypothetical protein Tco_0054106 [Tanacetum coccineum]